MTIKKDAYLDTVSRMEPDIALVDPGAYYASVSISLKRLADLKEIELRLKYNSDTINNMKKELNNEPR